MSAIIGAICGDIIGSRFEWNSIKTRKFELFDYNSIFTDDTVMTLAIADWLAEDKSSNEVLTEKLQYWGRKYPNAGYGGRFIRWLDEENPEPYGSWANGSAMRVSPCAIVAGSLNEAQQLAYTSAAVTHNHPEGIKGALATCDAIYLAKSGKTKKEIKNHIEDSYGYDLSRSLDEIRPVYDFDVSCAGSVPESIICFLEAEDYEDAIRNAVSLGGDADTQAAIAGSIAGVYWDVPDEIADECISRLTGDLMEVLSRFEDKFDII